MKSGLKILTALTFPLLFLSKTVWAEEKMRGQLDEILCHDGTTVLTKITTDNYITIEGFSRNSKVELPSHKVKDVLRADRPREYDIGLMQIRRGRYAAAAKCFSSVLRSADHRNKPWVIEYCNYRMGEAVYKGGLWEPPGKTTRNRFSPPEDYYAKMLKANPRSRYMLNAITRIPLCLTEQEKFEEARKAIMVAESAIKKYREETAEIGYRTSADKAEARLKMANAQLLEDKRDFEKAKEQYLVVQRMASKKYRHIHSYALEGELRCLMKQYKLADAKARAESLIEKCKESGDPALADVLPCAIAAVARGSLVEAGGFEAKNDKAQAQQSYANARRYYQKLLTSFRNRVEFTEEAIYFVGLCFYKLRDKEPDAMDMAIRYFRQVQRVFPNGALAKQAALDLKSLPGLETNSDF